MEIGQSVELGTEETPWSITALTVHRQESGAQVVLAYDTKRREYVLWDVTETDGLTECSNEVRTSTETEAMVWYVERTAKRLFTSRNHRAPGVTWELRNREQTVG